MGPWAYYAPFWIGLLLPFGLQQAVFAHPFVAALAPAFQWAALTLLAILLALELQLLMIGTQGAFAQVLPVPGGRSIRGRGAVVTGVLIVASVVLSWIVQLLWSDGLSRPGIVVGICGLVAAVTALLIYLWSWPMAARDFASR
jgi:hypothetical protein